LSTKVFIFIIKLGSYDNILHKPYILTNQ